MSNLVNEQAARQLVEDIYRDMQRSIAQSLDSEALWEAAARLGHAVILDEAVSGRIEGSGFRLPFPKGLKIPYSPCGAFRIGRYWGGRSVSGDTFCASPRAS